MREINTEALRDDLRMTRPQFCAVYGIAVNTLRDWEQGRRRPDTTARTYLHAIAADPEGVRKARETRVPWEFLKPLPRLVRAAFQAPKPTPSVEVPRPAPASRESVAAGRAAERRPHWRETLTPETREVLAQLDREKAAAALR